jgi:methionyl-tRNA formyltransferase
VKIIFAGTPDFAASHLQSIISDSSHQILAVYTQPDRPSGRGKKLSASPVKKLAEAHGIKVLQPASLREHRQQELMADLQADLMVVVAYGLILPQAILDTPRLGCINVHGSVLPRWRGAAPIQRAIEAGDAESGVTIMQMDSGLDTGSILSTSRCALANGETSGTLYQRLAALGASSLTAMLVKLEAGNAVSIEQDSSQSTYAAKIDKAEALINWSLPATTIERCVRAFNPSPTAFSLIEGQRFKVWDATVIAGVNSAAAGHIGSFDANGLLVGCGQDALLLREIQLAGKPRMPIRELLKSRSELFASGKLLGL